VIGSEAFTTLTGRRVGRAPPLLQPDELYIIEGEHHRQDLGDVPFAPNSSSKEIGVVHMSFARLADTSGGAVWIVRFPKNLEI
jgi:hypothetical protein